MYNPLISSPKNLKDEDLSATISELIKKYGFAAKMGQGHLCEQIAVAIKMYTEEQSRRQQDATANSIKKQDRNLDDLINVD